MVASYGRQWEERTTQA